MKNRYKALLIVILLLTVFAACSAPEPEIVPEYITGQGNSADLEGAVISWGYNSQIADKTQCAFGFNSGTAFADMALERMHEVEKDLNCRINMDYGENVKNNLTASLISGSRLYNIVSVESYFMFNEVRGGSLYGLSSYLDLHDTEKYGTPDMLTTVTFKDDVFCVVPFAWPELLYTSFIAPILVNEDLISIYGFEDPRDYVENGTWTWDTFEERLQAYTFKDGERQLYGMSARDGDYAVQMFLSNGVSFVEHTSSGIECGVYTQAGIQALERAQRIYRDTCRNCFTSGNEVATVVNHFKQDDSFLMVACTDWVMGDISGIVYCMDNIGVLPFPLGPNAEPGVYKSHHASLWYATGIPVNVDNPEASAIIIDRMFEPFKGYETKEDIIEYMGSQVFFDVRDAKIYYEMLANTEYCFNSNGGNKAINECMGLKTVSEVLDSYRTVYDDLIEKYIIPHYQGRIAVYGE